MTWTDLDYSDPCALLAALRPAYYALLAGSAEERVRFGEREVVYSRTSLTALQAEVRRLEGVCAAKTSGRPTRFAIR